MEHPVIKIISGAVTMEQGESALILSYFTKKRYKRNDLLIHEGELSPAIFFVEKGGLHMCYNDENGNERSCDFIFENEFITDLLSFSKKIPAACFIKALEPTICYVITSADFSELLEYSPATRAFYSIIVEQIAAEGIRRTKSLQSSSPEKMFVALLEHRPNIFQRVPQRYIAQYLGIAPESLSRIKKRMLTQLKS
jgi:CRP-like cAMP-binding protein